jgi:hypothetical protein
MTICEPFYEGLNRRLTQKMTIDQISQEMCRGVQDPRRKIIRIIKEYKGENYLFENSDWLEYQIQKKTIVQETKPEAIKKVAKNCITDLVRSEQNVHDTSSSVVPETTVSNKILIDPPKVNTISKIEKAETAPTAPVIETVSLAGWTTTNEPKIETSGREIEKLVSTNVISIEPKIEPIVDTTPSVQENVSNNINIPSIIEKNCIIGKNVPDCNRCEYRMEYNSGWGCDSSHFDCTSKICFFGDEITCECGFKTRHKSIFFGHISKLHADREDLIKQTAGKLLWDNIKREIILCPCGCNCGYRDSSESKNRRFYAKNELDEIKKNAKEFDEKYFFNKNNEVN